MIRTLLSPFLKKAKPKIELWYPKALKNINPDPKQFKSGEMKTRGEYAKGYPLGAVVHHSAGRRNPLGTLRTGLKSGYLFFVIGPNGTVYQNFPLNRWGYHAGRSFWSKLVDGVSDDLVGIEVCAAGKLEKKKDGTFETWFGETLDPSEVRFSERRDNIEKGHYQKFTPEQESSLIELILWLKKNAPEIFSLDLVVGHDEVSPGRKNDPGASLSMTMAEFRKHLRNLENKKS